MKTKKQQISEMIEQLQDNLVKLEIVQSYRQFVFENDEDLKGNTEAKKELNATDFAISKDKKMLEWLKKELK